MSLPFLLKPRGPAQIIGHGCSGMIAIDPNDELAVLKSKEVWLNDRFWGRHGSRDSEASLSLEDTVYNHLGPHPQILKYYGKVLLNGKNIFALKLERALGCLRQFTLDYPPPSEQTRLKMAMEVASGMAYIHSKGIIHCDFNCRNIFVFEDWLLKIGNFGGSEIKGISTPEGASLAGEETRYSMPLRGRDYESLDDTKRELFAIGCGIYEIMAWTPPFKELANEQITEKYANDEFSDTEWLVIEEIIRSCWLEIFDAAEDVEIALKKIWKDTYE